MKIEEINSAMTHGKSEAWSTVFAIVKRHQKNILPEPVWLHCASSEPNEEALGKPRASSLFLRADTRVLQ